jgi:hypothetical protein
MRNPVSHSLTLNLQKVVFRKTNIDIFSFFEHRRNITPILRFFFFLIFYAL